MSSKLLKKIFLYISVLNTCHYKQSVWGKECGKIPVVNGRFKMSVRCFEIWTWRSFNILVGMLLGPVDLLLLREEIILGISSSVIWLNMIDSWILGGKKTEKDLLEKPYFGLHFLSNCWEKVVKDIGNRKRICNKISFINDRSWWMVITFIFRRYNRFNTFPGFLIFFSKIPVLTIC